MTMGDVTECKQTGQNDEFPDTIYLAKNQLIFVEKVEAEDRRRTVSDTKSKIALFEKPKQESKPPVKKNKPKVNKLKKNALNAKFAHVKINPMALKPGSPGKHKIVSKEKDVKSFCQIH